MWKFTSLVKLRHFLFRFQVKTIKINQLISNELFNCTPYASWLYALLTRKITKLMGKISDSDRKRGLFYRAALLTEE